MLKGEISARKQKGPVNSAERRKEFSETSTRSYPNSLCSDTMQFKRKTGSQEQEEINYREWSGQQLNTPICFSVLITDNSGSLRIRLINNQLPVLFPYWSSLVYFTYRIPGRWYHHIFH
jgi:hypothetical protein